MRDVLLVGAGGHCRSCIEVLLSTGTWSIGGIVGRPAEVGHALLDIPVIASDDDLETLRTRFEYALVTVGQIQSAEPRRRLYKLLRGLGYKIPTVVAASATVSRYAILGAGTIVMHGVHVNAGAEVGENVILNTGCIVEHDVRIDHDCHISTGAILNGGVTVGAASFVGSGAVVVQGQHIPEGAFVKARTRYYERRS